MRNSCLVALCTFSLVCSSCFGQQPNKKPELQSSKWHVTELNGGSMVTNLGYGIQVNKGSSLQRRWYVLNNETCPVKLYNAGVRTVFESSRVGGDYRYRPEGTADVKQPVTAIEVRFILFDVWGRHMQTLSATHITDASGDLSLENFGSWRAWENDVSEVMNVVSFVARVRTTEGEIWSYDGSTFIRELEKIKLKLTEKELSPEREKPKN